MIITFSSKCFDSICLEQNFSRGHVRLIRQWLLASTLCLFLKLGHYLLITSALSILRHSSKVICSAYENTSAGFFLTLWSSSFGPGEFLQVPRSMLSYMSTTKLTRGDYFKMQTPRFYCQYLDSSSPRGPGNVQLKVHSSWDFDTSTPHISVWEKLLSISPLGFASIFMLFFSTPFYEYIRVRHWVGNTDATIGSDIFQTQFFFPEKKSNLSPKAFGSQPLLSQFITQQTEVHIKDSLGTKKHQTWIDFC